MCPNCRAFISTSDRVCPYCEVQLGPRAVDMRPAEVTSSFLPRANTTSIVVLTVNCVVFLVEMLLNTHAGGGSGLMGISPRVALALGCKFGPFIAAGQWWRFFTAGFLHWNLFHLAMNSYALIILVTEVEQFYGTARFIVAYIGSSVAGFVLSTVQYPAVPSAGASAAAFGMIGVMLAMAVTRRRDPLAHLIRGHYMQYLIFSLVLSFFPGIDIYAHIGGAAGGFLIGLVAGLPGLPRSPRETVWTVIAGVILAVTAYAFLQDWIFLRANATALFTQS